MQSKFSCVSGAYIFHFLVCLCRAAKTRSNDNSLADGAKIDDEPTPVVTRSGLTRSATPTSGNGVVSRDPKTGDSVDSKPKSAAGRTPATSALTNISTDNITNGSRNSKRSASDVNGKASSQGSRVESKSKDSRKRRRS